MRTITQDRAGPPGVLRMIDVPRPTPGLTEVLVRVHAAGVNPTDWKTRERGQYASGRTPPFTLGFDVSGVVEAVGTGVTLFAPGDEVFGMPRFPQPASAYADYVAAPARHFARKPERLTHVQAAALPLAALTAWQALIDTAGVQRGQRVLVHAAAGGVGHLAVQIAKSQGAYVIGTASASKHALLRRLGADELLDYRDTDFSAVLSDIDVVVDAIGGDYTRRSLLTMRDGGVLVCLLPAHPDFPADLAAELGVRATRMLVEPDHAGMSAIASLVEAGQLRVEIDSVHVLADAALAHERGETNRTTGKIVLSLVDDRPFPAPGAIPPPSRESDTSMEATTKAPPVKTTDEVVDVFLKHFGEGDIEALVALFATPVDFEVSGPVSIPWAGKRATPDDLATFFALFGTELSPPIEFTLGRRVTQGEHAVVFGRNIFQVLATRKTFINEFALHFTVTSGKISGYHMYEDTDAISTAFVPDN